MEETLEIHDYELHEHVGLKSHLSFIKIFPKRGSHNTLFVLLRFRASDNNDVKPVKQLVEDSRTGERVIRLFLGEDQRSSILDFLRNERIRNFTFRADRADFSTIGGNLGDSFDDGFPRTMNIFQLLGFELHSRGSRGRPKPLNPVSGQDPVVGQ